MKQRKITVATLAMVAVLICSILAISVFGATIKKVPFAESGRLGNQLKSLKSELAECEQTIIDAQAEIAAAQEKLPALEKEKISADNELKKANDALDEVCPNNYYRSYLCDETVNCEELHNKVSSAASKLSEINSELSEHKKAIEEANELIEETNARISEIKADIERVSAEKRKAFFGGLFFVLAMFVTIAGLVVLAKFLLSRADKKFGYIACGLMAGSSLLYLFSSTEISAFVHLFNIVVFAVFYNLIAEKFEARVALRVVAIIVSALILLAGLPSSIFIIPLYVLAMILVSLILVPCVYTEYLDIASHIFFTIITFGIWYLIWLYYVTENLNKVESAEKRCPVSELLLCIFLPFYYIYWVYKTAEITELYGAENGKQFKIGILSLAFTFICPILPSVIIQDKTNVILGKPEEPAV